MKRLWVVVLFLAVIILSGCGSGAASPTAAAQPTQGVAGKLVNVEGGSYRDVTAQELDTMLKHKDFTMVNVHIPFEGNLPSTDVSIPYDQVGLQRDKLPADKNAKIVLYCRSGRMSEIAANTLVKLGYTNLWNLSGGMIAWEQAGFKIEK